MALTLKETRAYTKELREERKRKEIQLKEHLIKLVHERVSIWDRRETCYRDRSVKEIQWQEIAIVINLPKEKCKNMWKCLLDGFRERLTGAMKQRSGESSEQASQRLSAVSWPFFKSMFFMKEILEMRESYSNYEDVDTSIESFLPGDEVDGHEGCSSTERNYLPGQSLSEDIRVSSPENNDTREFETPEFERNCQSSSLGSPNLVLYNRARQYSRAHPYSQKMTGRSKTNEDSMLSSQFEEMDRQGSAFGCNSFPAYLAEVINDLPKEKKRQCELVMLQVANVFLEGNTPIIATINKNAD